MLQFPQFFGVFDLNGNLVIGFIQGNSKPWGGCQWSHGPAILQHVPACGNGNSPVLFDICTWAYQVVSLHWCWGGFSPPSSPRSAACSKVGRLLPPGAGSSRFIARGDSVMVWDACLCILFTFMHSDDSHPSFPNKCLAKPRAKF